MIDGAPSMKCQGATGSERPPSASFVQTSWGIHTTNRISIRANGIQWDLPVLFAMTAIGTRRSGSE